MGWTCTHKPKGQKITDFFVSHGTLRWSNDSPWVYTILDGALVKLSEFYAAVEKVHKETGERQVWAAVIMVKMFKEDRSGYNICYKDMDETVGPYISNCPERILKLLSPTENEYANSWRKCCWEKIEESKARPKLVPGMKVSLYGYEYTLDEPLGARGWMVRSKSGVPYRMKSGQVKQASIVQ